MHLCYPRKLNTITGFPLSHQHIIKWLSTPFYTHGMIRIHLTPTLGGARVTPPLGAMFARPFVASARETLTQVVTVVFIDKEAQGKQ